MNLQKKLRAMVNPSAELEAQLEQVFIEVGEELRLAQDAPDGTLADLFSTPALPAPAAKTSVPAEETKIIQAPAPVKSAPPLIITPEAKQVSAPDVTQVSKSSAAPQPIAQPLSHDRNAWANDPLIRMAASQDPAEAEVALTTLNRMGRQVHKRILGLAQQPVTPLHDGALSYFEHQLGQRMVFIPPGRFVMGSDPDQDPLAAEDEQPQTTFTLTGFWIGWSPVTVEQYRTFVTQTGYESAHADSLAGQGNYPAINISWHDGMAYCRWLRKRTGLPVSMPSEAEWEKAARGSEGQLYPWGNFVPSQSNCGYERAAVGSYSPAGDSPFGCVDMGGNVWEWTRSSYQPYPYDHTDGRDALTGTPSRVVRGLTFNDLARYTRCATRYPLRQNMRLNSLGFRIAVIPPA